MKNKRKRFTAQEKNKILRLHLIEKLTVVLLNPMPGNLLSQDHPTILPAEFAAKRKVEILEFHLMWVVFAIHPCLQVQWF